MAVLLNGAGISAADPTENGLAVEIVFVSPSMDVATLNGAWIDQGAGFPGTNSIVSGLSPANTVVIGGNAGTYDDTTKRLSIVSTTGLSVGDYIYLSHASITAGIYKIASIPVA